MPQPIYAAFTGNTLKFLPLTPYRGIIPEGTVISGFPDGIRGSVGVKLVKIENGTFERVYVDLDGVKNTEYYPVRVTTADLGDGRIREHLTNDEDCLWLNGLLDGPEKYLRGEFEKTRRNEPARFVFMRKYEYPDDMYEIHNPETKKCNVFDASSGQLMFPDWCDAVEFKDGKWSWSNAPKLEDENKNMTEGISRIAVAFVESASDERIMRIASQLADKFLTPDTVKAISDKFDDMEYLSVFGTDDDFRITKEIKEPFHIVITAALESAVGGKDAGKRKAVTYYGNPPKITLFLSDSTGKPMSAYGLRRYTKMDRNFEDLRKRLVSSWREVLIHELSHALDQLTRGSNRFNQHSRQSMLKSARNASDSYANNLLETNARIPQLGNMLCSRTLERAQSGAQAFPSFNDAVRLFDEIMPFSRMTDDTKRRTVKRMHDIWARLKGVWDKHHDEIKTVQDFQKFLAEGQQATITELLGDCAVLDTVSSGRIKFKRVEGTVYKAIEADRPGDVGSVAKFNDKVTYNPANPQKVFIDDLQLADGRKPGKATLTVKSVKKENKNMTEGISALAAAFVESTQTRFTREEDLEKYADEVELKKLNEKMPEKKSGLVLVPADLVAIVARRMQAAAEYDGLNYVIDPEGLSLHLDNGYMTGTLSYDTHKEALVSPTGDGTYPLDDNTDLDWITKKILADMDPERFEEKIAGKYDEGRDLVATLASSLRSKAERMGRKFSFREDGYKLSVENKETGDNYSSTVLEYDPEAKELKGKDGGSSFRLDDGTNIRKLASEIFNRTETMDL